MHQNDARQSQCVLGSRVVDYGANPSKVDDCVTLGIALILESRSSHRRSPPEFAFGRNSEARNELHLDPFFTLVVPIGIYPFGGSF